MVCFIRTNSSWVFVNMAVQCAHDDELGVSIRRIVWILKRGRNIFDMIYLNCYGQIWKTALMVLLVVD